MNRRTLDRQFSTPGTTPWKTFVVEAHAGVETSAEFLADVFGKSAVHATDDVHLHSVHLEDEMQFTVDDLDGRFWSFHSTAPMEQASREIRRRVTLRRDLDLVWLPSYHLRQVSPGVHPSYLKTDFRGWSVLPSGEIRDLAIAVRGKDADRLLDVIRGQKDHEHAVSIDKLKVRTVDPELGTVDEAVNRFAHFVATGDSFALHQQVVAGVVRRYRALVEAAEARGLRFTSLGEDGGGRMHGSPIEVRFSRPIEDLVGFFGQLFSSREPFRLWGLYEASERYGECDGVDLHIGECVRIEAQPDLLRIHLFEGGCGNTVARLITNLQHHIDGALSLVDPELDALLRAEPVRSSAA